MERERTEALGMRILCSVLMNPRTFSPKLLAISSGNGSRPPKSPNKSGPEVPATMWRFGASRVRVRDGREEGNEEVGGEFLLVMEVAE